MAPKKNKKKTAVNPARGFATTSTVSKARAEPVEAPAPPAESSNEELRSQDVKDVATPESQPAPTDATAASAQLSPEEFERQLEESALQIIVGKYSLRAKREAGRQITRLQTDRRLLRGHAEFLNTRKWLPSELMDEILEVIAEDHRTQAANESAAQQKPLTEEDLIMRFWILQQTLEGAGFPDDKVRQNLDYILSISDKIPGSKDSIWGLEESLQWLARECSRDELPDYDSWQTKVLQDAKPQLESPQEAPSASGTNTPRAPEADLRGLEVKDSKTEQTTKKDATSAGTASAPKKAVPVIDYESDIDADELVPVYLDTKTKLFRLQPNQRSTQSSDQRGRGGGGNKRGKKNQAPSDPEIARLESKVQKIESDVLFDKYVAEQEWQKMRIELEKEAAAQRQAQANNPPEPTPPPAETPVEDSEGSDDEITRESARIGAEMLEDNSSDDEGITDLFANLPVTEVDSEGKSSTVVNGTDGVKVTIRDFGKSMGVSPRRILEEACRSRDTSVKIAYTLVSATSYSNRHSIRINWSKAQEALPSVSEFPEIECSSTPKSVTVTMTSISTPTSAQSESYVATASLFLIFSTSAREEKVFLRLPPAWRDLWTEFAAARKEKADALERDVVRGFRDMIRQKRDREEEDGVVLTTSFKRRALQTPNDTGDESGPERPGKPTASPESLQRLWHEKSNMPSYQKMLQSRMQLPMWSYRDEVLRTIDREQVVIVCGETGCGKSTQVPSFILEHQLSQGKACKIYCTEPRRISAISLAKRVSEEIGERKNDIGTMRSLIGYAIRLETNTSKETRLVYATTGIVMRMLEGSNDLREITHIVLDEVHERTIDSDFLLIILRKLMIRRPDIKVVLMSATVDAERFSRYLDGAPVLQVPGRTFPVASYYLEDAVEVTGYNLDSRSPEKKYTELDDDADVEEANNEEKKAENTKSLRSYSPRTRNTIAQMDEYRIDFELVTLLIAKIAHDESYIPFSKAILVFLPGIGEIRQLNDMLVGHPAFRKDWYVFPLHSSIASEDQEDAFLVPPPGVRKIVLATNIAETGITIPDVTCVIDTGKHREMRFDERRQLSRLLETFISKANAKQRKGRAGRVQEGLCFHLFTKFRHDELMADQQTPELLRLSLQDLAIRVKTCKLGGIEETLAEALDPPSTKNIRRAVDALVDVKALTPSEELTPLGTQLSRLPLDVFLGKLILLGSIFKCLDAAISIAAILSSKSPFQAPFGARQQADTVRRAFRRSDSDLMTDYNAYLAWKRACTGTGSEHQFCRKNYLNPQTLSNIEDLKGQLTASLVDSGFLPLTEQEKSHIKRNRYSSRRHDFFELPQRANVNSENDLITQSVIAWALYPKLLVKDGKGFRNVANNQNISLHPTSVNKGHPEIQWLSYYHIMQAKQFYNAHETTAVADFAIALLCGDVRCDLYSGIITLDGNRARFAVSDWKTLLVIKTLRGKLRDIMAKSFKNPGKPLTAQQAQYLELWQKIFSQESLLRAKGFLKD